MPFVNETASEQDIVKYGLRAQDLEFYRSSTPKTIKWAIDRENNSYLRFMRSDGRRDPVTSEFVFYWRGNLVNIELETIKFFCEGRDYAEATVRLSITYPPQKSFWLPDALISSRQEIIDDFKQALITRGGTSSSGEYKEYKLNFEF